MSGATMDSAEARPRTSETDPPPSPILPTGPCDLSRPFEYNSPAFGSMVGKPQLLPASELSAATLSTSDPQEQVDSTLAYAPPFPANLDPIIQIPTARRLGPEHAQLFRTPLGADSDERQKAREALEHHMAGKWALLRTANDELQKMTEVRCARPFQLPEAPFLGTEPAPFLGTQPVPAVWVNPGLKHLVKPSIFLAKGVSPTKFLELDRDMQWSEQQHLNGRGGAAHPDEPQGLRETLLMHGCQPYGNQVKTVLRSLSFHDWTQNLTTGAYNNDLLGHFVAGNGISMVMYEVNVPSPNQPPDSMPSRPKLERWIWFLLSLPLISVSPDLDGEAGALPPGFPAEALQTFWVCFAAPIQTEQQSCMYPYDMEPVQNVGIHPPVIEAIYARATAFDQGSKADTTIPNRSSNPAAPYPISSSTLKEHLPRQTFERGPTFRCGRPHVVKRAQRDVIRAKRFDLDFSKHGIPAFEFTPTCFRRPLETFRDGLGSALEGKDFVGAQGITSFKAYVDGWEEEGQNLDNPMSLLHPTRLLRSPGAGRKFSGDSFVRLNGAEGANWRSGDGISDAAGEDDVSAEKSPHPMSAEGGALAQTASKTSAERPKRRMAAAEMLWWEHVKAQLWQDAHRWEKVKEAMAHGCCRVIARVEEVAVGERLDGDEEEGEQAVTGVGEEGDARGATDVWTLANSQLLIGSYR
ncbi:MAG: hypothetical protein M1818_000767 [Claussenomyces sp. TS43310]|nr:MAG: hypothetical protein M1818_000767 [Claussenomyces sp. TS43310]